MKSLTITIGGKAGCLFEGEVPETFCFVPQDFIRSEPDGLHVAEANYLRSGWGARNLRCNDAGDGHHLFPNPHRPVSDLDDRRVQTFLHRIEVMPAA